MKQLNFLILISLFLFSCGSGSDGEDDPGEMMNGTMTVIKDGVSFEIEATNNTLLSEVQSGNEGRRLDIRCNVDGGTLFISVSNWDFQNPPVDGILTKTYKTNEQDPSTTNSSCMDVGNFTLCDGALGTYTVGTTEIYTSEGFDIDEEGTITITGNDPSNKRVSGTFE
ncbi:MAG: hypothetical protein AAF985_17125, partial [Bacteroidota bacterium]